MRIDTRRRRRNRGFTLVELMIVVAIIGIVIAVIMGAWSKNKLDDANPPVECFWWKHDLCLCEVGDGIDKWGFNAPPGACD